MTELTEIINSKKESKKAFFRAFPQGKKSRAIILNYIRNPELYEQISQACEALGVFCINWNDNLKELDVTAYFWAIDACVTDETVKSDDYDVAFMETIIPIFPAKTKYPITEFHPMKFEGNAFLFKEANFYLIFEQICRFLENMQYAGDRRTLLKNLLTFNDKYIY